MKATMTAAGYVLHEHAANYVEFSYRHDSGAMQTMTFRDEDAVMLREEIADMLNQGHTLSRALVKLWEVYLANEGTK